MARPKKDRFIYSMDVAGLWLYACVGGEYIQVIDRPVINVRMQDAIKRAATEDRQGLVNFLTHGENNAD